MVLGHGPKNAKIVWIGETPGPEEIKVGKPFIGASGVEVKRTLKKFGINPDFEVFYDNACPEIVLPFPQGLKGFEILQKYNKHLATSEIWKSRTPKVVVACGGWALRRILAHRIKSVGLSKLTINAWHGSVIHWTKEEYAAAKAYKLMAFINIPIGSVVIPVMHPAVWAGRKPRDPSRTHRPTFARFVRRVCRYALGELKASDVYTLPTIGEGGLDDVPDSDRYFIDFEFIPEPVNGDYRIRRPWLLGVSTGPGEPVYQGSSYPEMRRFIERAFVHNNAKFIAQNTCADIRPARFLLNNPDWFPRRYDDLMLLHAVLQPDLDHNLSFIARYALDNVRDWKWLSGNHMEEVYNRFDVDMLAMAFDSLRNESKHVPHDPMIPYNEFLRAMPRMMCIEDIGMRVDNNALIEERKRQQIEISEASIVIQSALSDVIEKRINDTELQIVETRAKIEATLSTAQSKARTAAAGCSNDHKPYKMSVKPKCPQCLNHYKLYVLPAREAVSQPRKEVTKLKRLAVELATAGFRVGNDNDTRWYINTVLNRRTRRKTPTGLMKVEERDLELFAGDPVVDSILRAKHAQKLLNTFLNVKIDKHGYAHPPIMLHGTAAGRPSSGREKKGEIDKVGDQLGAFNAFNIPKSVRHIYIPDRGHTFVGGDYSDLEGRIMALYTAEPVLCELYRTGKDVHSYVAAICFADKGVTYENARTFDLTFGFTTHSARFFAKRVAHGKRYGMGLGELARQLRIPKTDAKLISDKIDELFPTIAQTNIELIRTVFGEWELVPGGQFKIIQPALRYHVTAFNRIRYYPGVESAVKKELISQEPQSNGAVMWHRLVDNICEWNNTSLREFGGRFVIGTYDSVALSVPKSQAESCAKWLKEIAELPHPGLASFPGAKLMPILLPFDISIGDNYAKL